MSSHTYVMILLFYFLGGLVLFFGGSLIIWLITLRQPQQRGQAMGYTTEFTGAVKLGRKLTMAEAKDLLELADDSDAAKSATGIDAYFQWVPADTLEHIVWDGNEKFYKYTDQLRWLCKWLAMRKISAEGSLYWQGEETGDTGTLTVSDNNVFVNSNAVPSVKSPRPLSLDALGKMALDQVTAS